MNEEFTALSNGSLSGQGTWTTVNNNTIILNVADASPIMGCTGAAGKYVQPVTAATFTTERLSFPTTNFTANTSQVFYLSFLLNISNTGSDVNAHIISMGNDFGATLYEFTRLHVRTSGAGYNIGISEGGGTGLGVNSGGGINWGTAILNLGQTYHIVLRYDYFNGAGLNSDIIRAWVNPGLTAGSEPTLASVQATIGAGTLGNDILFDGDNVRNIYLNNRNNGPAYKIDAIRYARGANAATAWSNMGISSTCSALPVVWHDVNIVANNNNQPVLYWSVEEVSVKDYIIEKSSDGTAFRPVATIPGKGNGKNNYTFIDVNYHAGEFVYRIKQMDADGRYSYSKTCVFRSVYNGSGVLYPNPVINQAVLTVSNNLLNTNTTLYDIHGKLLKKIQIIQSSTIINMIAYPSGIYSLQLENGTVIKIIKR